MKKLDMNIKVDRDDEGMGEKKQSDVEVVIMWIGNMIERAVNKPDLNTGRATGAAKSRHRWLWNNPNLEYELWKRMQSENCQILSWVQRIPRGSEWSN